MVGLTNPRRDTKARLRYVFVMALVVAVLGLSFVVDRGAGEQHVVTGTVTEWGAGESIKVVNESTDPQFRIRLRDTVYEGDASSIAPGDRATVWYRSVGERLPVAVRVRVLSGVR
jgi:hypothetical protein